NSNSSTARPARPNVREPPRDTNHWGVPAPIPCGPAFMSTCTPGRSVLTTPTSPPSARPAPSPRASLPVGAVTDGTIATAAREDRSVRTLSAAPRSPTPEPADVRAYRGPNSPSCTWRERPTLRLTSQLVASRSEPLLDLRVARGHRVGVRGEGGALGVRGVGGLARGRCRTAGRAR